jgi:hypothetical protein
MASGHGYRTQRPNTWLLRPSLRRDDSSCQPGAVHTWPLTDLGQRLCNRLLSVVERTMAVAGADFGLCEGFRMPAA